MRKFLRPFAISVIALALCAGCATNGVEKPAATALASTYKTPFGINLTLPVQWEGECFSTVERNQPACRFILRGFNFIHMYVIENRSNLRAEERATQFAIGYMEGWIKACTGEDLTESTKKSIIESTEKSISMILAGTFGPSQPELVHVRFISMVPKCKGSVEGKGIIDVFFPKDSYAAVAFTFHIVETLHDPDPAGKSQAETLFGKALGGVSLQKALAKAK